MDAINKNITIHGTLATRCQLYSLCIKNASFVKQAEYTCFSQGLAAKASIENLQMPHTPIPITNIHM